MNNQFELRADFSSPYALQDVFLVLDLKLEGGKHYIYLREIGDLKPDDSRWLKVDVNLTSPFGQGSYQLHVFAGGEEVLNTQQRVQDRAGVFDRMIVKRVEKIRDAEPQLFVVRQPIYPPEMARIKQKGRAVVRFRILGNGTTSDAKLREASDAAFGASALDAVKQWRFIPKVKNGEVVETEVEMPFAFSPPNEPEA